MKQAIVSSSCSRRCSSGSVIGNFNMVLIFSLHLQNILRLLRENKGDVNATVDKLLQLVQAQVIQILTTLKQ